MWARSSISKYASGESGHMPSAVPAIREADPDAMVLNSGVSMGGLGVVRADQLYRAGDIDGAIAQVEQIVREAAGIRPPDERRVPTNQAGLEAYLATPSARRHVRFFELEVAHQHLYDAFQIHYYGPADGLAPIVDAVRAGGITLPIEAWELGRRYRGQVPFTEETHAAEVVQLLTTAAGEGLTNNVLVRFRDWVRQRPPRPRDNRRTAPRVSGLRGDERPPRGRDRPRTFGPGRWHLRLPLPKR